MSLSLISGLFSRQKKRRLILRRQRYASISRIALLWKNNPAKLDPAAAAQTEDKSKGSETQKSSKEDPSSEKEKGKGKDSPKQEQKDKPEKKTEKEEDGEKGNKTANKDKEEKGKPEDKAEDKPRKRGKTVFMVILLRPHNLLAVHQSVCI